MTRVLCVRLPDWPVQRVLAERRRAEAAATPPRTSAAAGSFGPILIRQRDPRRGDCVEACCALARQAGIRVGMPLSEAQGLAQAAAEIWPADPQADQQALQRLAEGCERFSPVVGWRTLEPRAADLAGNGAAANLDAGLRGRGTSAGGWGSGGWLLLEVTGIGPLFGGERPLLREVLAECSRLGYIGHAAIADTIGAAWGVTVAWEADAQHVHERIVAPEETAAVLAGLPVAALRVSPQTVETLRQLGVVRIEQLERLPRASLAARLGPELLVRLDQARGAVAELIQPYRPPPQFAADWRLEEPTTNERALGHILRKLLERIAAELAPRKRGIVQLVVRLDVAGRPPRLVRLDLFRPSGSPRHWEELVRLRWARLDEGGPVGRVTVQAALTAPLEQRQQQLFAGGNATAQREWGGLLERLTSRLGNDAVLAVEQRREGLPEHDFRYRPWIEWRPDEPSVRPAEAVRATRARVKKSTRRAAAPALRSPPDKSGATKAQARADGADLPSAVCDRPLLVEPVPRPLEVMAAAAYGPPGSFRWQGVWRRVARWWGPERVETGWWRGPSVRRDYYRLETTTGDRWWLFRDLTDGQWYLHGSFD